MESIGCPSYLQPEEVERIISSCDPRSPVGRRDRAILLLLARLALRAGDIVQLRLSDIDTIEPLAETTLIDRAVLHNVPKPTSLYNI